MLDTKYYTELTNLIGKFNKDRNSMSVSELQTLREDIALSFFYISDFSSRCIANYDAKDYERKRFYASKEEFFRNEVDDRTGKNYNVADSERLARIEGKKIDNETSDALRQKEKIRIITIATQQILNSLSGRISQLSK